MLRVACVEGSVELPFDIRHSCFGADSKVWRNWTKAGSKWGCECGASTSLVVRTHFLLLQSIQLAAVAGATAPGCACV